MTIQLQQPAEGIRESYKAEGKYRYEVRTNPNDAWSTNAVRFDSAEDAEKAARDLFMRWLALHDWRVVHEDHNGTVVDVVGP